MSTFSATQPFGMGSMDVGQQLGQMSQPMGQAMGQGLPQGLAQGQPLAQPMGGMGQQLSQPLGGMGQSISQPLGQFGGGLGQAFPQGVEGQLQGMPQGAGMVGGMQGGGMGMAMQGSGLGMGMGMPASVGAYNPPPQLTPSFNPMQGGQTFGGVAGPQMGQPFGQQQMGQFGQGGLPQQPPLATGGAYSALPPTVVHTTIRDVIQPPPVVQTTVVDRPVPVSVPFPVTPRRNSHGVKLPGTAGHTPGTLPFEPRRRTRTVSYGAVPDPPKPFLRRMSHGATSGFVADRKRYLHE